MIATMKASEASTLSLDSHRPSRYFLSFCFCSIVQSHSDDEIVYSREIVFLVSSTQRVIFFLMYIFFLDVITTPRDSLFSSASLINRVSCSGCRVVTWVFYQLQRVRNVIRPAMKSRDEKAEVECENWLNESVTKKSIICSRRESNWAWKKTTERKWILGRYTIAMLLALRSCYILFFLLLFQSRHRWAALTHTT